MDQDLLIQAGTTAGSVSAVVGVLWWLLAPRVRDYLETIVLEALQAQHVQLQGVVTKLGDHGERLAAVVARLEGHDQQLDRLDRVVSRPSPVELTELADLLQVVQQHRPRHVRLADVADLERQDRTP